MRSLRFALLLVVSFFLGECVQAQSEEGGVERPSLEALALPDDADIRIDGRLDEAVWREAQVATGFVQSEPEPGAQATERTEAAVLYGEDAVVVGIRAFVNDPETFTRRMGRRDQFVTTDRVAVAIDSYADGRTAFWFGLTAAGVQQDVLYYDDDREDASWDAVWNGAVARTAEGFEAEFQIPYSQLRYDAKTTVQNWNIQFERQIEANGETVYWSPRRRDREGYVSQFGGLTGVRELPQPLRVEVRPYASTRLTREPGSADDPFYNENALSPSAGLDAQLGLSSSLTLTATINPDFGQVEADPAVVNLSQFEVSFNERRPFFVEGTDIFSFDGSRFASVYKAPRFFYSRRIGREPVGGGARGAAYSDRPQETTIAVAGKLSGQVGAWSLGMLDAVTTGEFESFYRLDESGELMARGDTLIEPATNYFVGRARRSWRGGASSAGVFLSSVMRNPEADLAGRLSTRATVGGVDGEHAFANRAWTLSGQFAGSFVEGDEAFLQRLQTRPQRYYRRPDAGYLTYDPEATSLAGYRGEVALARTGGGNRWRGHLAFGATSPGFEVNDLGFQTRADILTANWRVQRLWLTPSLSSLHYSTLYAYGTQAFNYGGDHIWSAWRLGTFSQFTNLWSTAVIASFSPEVTRDRLTRGGVLALRPPDVSAVLQLNTNARKAFSANFTTQLRRELPADYAGVKPEWATVFNTRFIYRITDALEVALSPEWTRAFNTDQFVTRLSDASGGGIGGSRPVFVDLRQNAFYLGIRADWAFSPTLTLQTVIGPYVASANVERFRELREAGGYDFDVYGEDRGSVEVDEENNRYIIAPGDGYESPNGFSAFALPYTGSGTYNFNYRSLRGNAVLRWQWRPGSALFFVWQQTRDEYAPYDGFDAPGEVGEIFSAPLKNVFLFKVTYWFGL